MDFSLDLKLVPSLSKQRWRIVWLIIENTLRKTQLKGVTLDIVSWSESCMYLCAHTHARTRTRTHARTHTHSCMNYMHACCPHMHTHLPPLHTYIICTSLWLHVIFFRTSPIFRSHFGTHIMSQVLSQVLLITKAGGGVSHVNSRFHTLTSYRIRD